LGSFHEPPLSTCALELAVAVDAPRVLVAVVAHARELALPLAAAARLLRVAGRLPRSSVRVSAYPWGGRGERTLLQVALL